jgi:uncharacterized phage protein (TIGR01671 family)
MSKEIKFRAWDNYSKSFIENDEYLIGLNGKFYRMDFYSGIENYEDGSLIWNELQNITLSQFTGLLDKNGKEIFENDIVCWTFDEKTKKEIVFHEGCFGHFIFMGINSEYSEFIPIHKKRAENMIVCGSIYQNPELIGGEND